MLSRFAFCTRATPVFSRPVPRPPRGGAAQFPAGSGCFPPEPGLARTAARAGSAAARRGDRPRCTRSARGRWGRPDGTATRGTGPVRAPARARSGRLRRRRSRALCSSRTSRTGARSDPIRDGLMLTIRGGKASASMSAIEWIGASQVSRSCSPASTAGGLRVDDMSASSSQASGNASTTRR